MCVCAEEEKDDVEKKVGEALDENFTVLEEKIEERQKRAGMMGSSLLTLQPEQLLVEKS